jgi:type I restriction enzyme M protein
MVLRRLDCVLEPSKQKVLKAAKSLNVDATKEMQEKLLAKSTGLKLKVYNRAPFTMAELRNQDPKDLYSNLIDYIHGFPEFLQDVFIKRFELPFKLAKLEEKKKLFSVFDKICQMILHPENISNLELGYLYEELIRKFGEITSPIQDEREQQIKKLKDEVMHLKKQLNFFKYTSISNKNRLLISHKDSI